MSWWHSDGRLLYRNDQLVGIVDTDGLATELVNAWRMGDATLHNIVEAFAILHEKTFFRVEHDRAYCIDCGARQEGKLESAGWHTRHCRLPGLGIPVKK